MPIVTLMGAGGKMGLRLTENLKKSTYEVRHVEISEAGREALAARGIETVAVKEAVASSDVVILAIPDNRIGQVSHQIEPWLRRGAMLVILDAAAPYAGALPKRDDLAYFVTHPCHPPVIHDETEPAAQLDFFGGVHAKQHIVCALMQGSEEDYALGEQVARTIYAPVMRANRCTVEQIAILEPVLSETIGATCMTVIREATDEAVRRGVPEQAARDFILGHLKVEIGIVFKLFEGACFSDGAIKAVEDAKKQILQPDWKKVFEPEAMLESVRGIADPPVASGADRGGAARG
jgi:hypothetical protein